MKELSSSNSFLAIDKFSVIFYALIIPKIEQGGSSKYPGFPLFLQFLKKGSKVIDSFSAGSSYPTAASGLSLTRNKETH